MYTIELFEHELEMIQSSGTHSDISIYFSFIVNTSERWRCSCPVNLDFCSPLALTKRFV